MPGIASYCILYIVYSLCWPVPGPHPAHMPSAVGLAAHYMTRQVQAVHVQLHPPPGAAVPAVGPR